MRPGSAGSAPGTDTAAAGEVGSRSGRGGVRVYQGADGHRAKGPMEKVANLKLTGVPWGGYCLHIIGESEIKPGLHIPDFFPGWSWGIRLAAGGAFGLHFGAQGQQSSGQVGLYLAPESTDGDNHEQAFIVGPGATRGCYSFN